MDCQVFDVLIDDLLNKDEIADSLLLMDQARFFHTADAGAQL